MGRIVFNKKPDADTVAHFKIVANAIPGGHYGPEEVADAKAWLKAYAKAWPSG